MWPKKLAVSCLLIMSMLVACEPSAGPSPAIPVPTPTPVPDMKVLSVEISKDYSDRKSTAERIYQGKLAEIQGRIVHIKYDEQASLFEIDLNGAGRFTGNVVCKVKHAELQPDPEKTDPIKLVKEQIVIVRGNIIGVPGRRNIVVQPCTVLDGRRSLDR